MSSQGTQIGNKYYTTAQINDTNMQEEIRQAVVGGGAIRNNLGNGNWEQQANGMNQVTQQPQAQAQLYNYQQQPNIADLIRQQSEANKASIAAQLQKTRDLAVSGYNQKIGGLQGTYQPLRDSQDFQGAKNINATNESMASMGLQNSGDLITAQVQNRVGNENSINALNNQQQSDKTNFENLIANANNAYNSDLASSNAGIDAQALQNLINQSNSDRSFDYQAGRDTIGDNRYNQSYTDGRNDINYDRNYQSGRDNVQDTGMLANGQYTQQGQTNNLNMQVQQAQLKEMQDPNSTTNQMAKLGLQTAQLNFAYLPQQLQSQAQQIAQQLSQGAIDLKTAQTQLNYLPQQLQAAINAQNASAAASGRSNQGSSGGLTPTQQRAASAKEIKNAAYAQFNKAMSAGNGSQWLISNADNIITSIGEDVYYDMEKRITSESNMLKEMMKNKANTINKQQV